MAQRGARDDWDSLADRPSVLHVTVESAAPRPRLRVGGARSRVAASLVIAVAVVCAGLAVGGIGAGRHSAARIASVYAPAIGPAVHIRGVGQLLTSTEAYRFPLGCMGTTMTRQGLATALRDRTGPCWRYGVYVTAILRRVRGVWRLGLEATSRLCPRIPLPPAVEAQLLACRR